MQKFQKSYTIINSGNEEIAAIFKMSLIAFIIYLIILKNISYLFLVLIAISIYPYIKGLGKLSISTQEDEKYYFSADGTQAIQGKITDISYGWSYRFSLPSRMNSSSRFSFFRFINFRNPSSQRASQSFSNAIIINIIIELDHQEKIVVQQQLAPWREMPKGWKFVGDEIKNYRYFYKIKSGLKKWLNNYLTAYKVLS